MSAGRVPYPVRAIRTVIFQRGATWLQRGRRLLLSGPTLAVGVFLVYMRTLAPGVFGFDSAELATGAHSLGIVHPPGYPLYLLIAKAFTFLPLRSVAYRLNVMSAVFGALTILLLFELAKRLTGRPHVAWYAASLFAVTNYFWQMALVAEVYTLHTFFLALDLLLLLTWQSSGRHRYLVLFSFTYGLSLANHTSGVLFAPGFAWLVLNKPHRTWRDWLRTVGALSPFLLGLAPYLYLPLRATANPPVNFAAYYNIDLTTPYGVWWMMSGQAWFFMFGYEEFQMVGEIAKFSGYLWRSFLGIGVIFGVLGVVSLWRRMRNQAIGLLVLFAANVAFYVNYRVVDKDTMFLPAYLIWTLFMAEGMKAALLWAKQMVGSGQLLSVAKPSLAALFFSLAPVALVFNWQWVDMSSSEGPSLFAEQVLKTAEPDSMIMAQWSSAAVLEYYQVVEGRRPDLIVYDRSRHGIARWYDMWRSGTPTDQIFQTIGVEEQQVVDREIRQRTVYVIEYEPPISGGYVYMPEGDYFRLVPR